MYSGKFVLRIQPALHRQLKKRALATQLSLNELCNRYIRQALSASSNDAFSDLVEIIKKIWGNDLRGLLLFGSKARGDDTHTSDTDVLIVLSKDVAITRDLYSIWDDQVMKSFPQVSPQFVHLPSEPIQAGGIWFEVALEGEILWQSGHCIQELLAQLRILMASGKVCRRISHGHPYWEKREVTQSEK